jgi:hypothetical protein
MPNGAQQTVGEATVAIRARLDQFEKDLAQAEAKLRQFHDHTAHAPEHARGLQEAFSGMTETIARFGEASGPAKIFLTGLGAWGAAAAIGIGAIAEAFAHADEQTEKITKWAVGLRNTAEATGFTTSQVEALQRSATEAGLSGEQVNGWLQRFSFSLEAARTKGVGPLADALNKIDHQLLVQLQTTKSNAEAWDVFARATERASNKTVLMREAFGRGAGQAVLLLQATQQGGGLERVAESMEASSAATDEQIRKWAAMKGQIEGLKEQAELLMASIWPEGTLERQKAMNESLLELGKIIKGEASDFSFFQKLVTDWSVKITRMFPAALQPRMLEAEAERVRFMAAVNRQMGAAAPPVAGPQQMIPQHLTPLTIDAVREAVGSLTEQTLSAEAAFKELSDRMKALGPAITIPQRAALEIAKLKSDAAKNNDEQLKANTILGIQAVQAKAASDQIHALVGALGASATVEQKVAQEQAKLNVEQSHGIALTKQQIATRLDLTRAQALGVSAMQSATDKANIEAQVLGRGMQETKQFTLVQERLAQARRNGERLSEASIAAIEKEAAAQAGAEAALAKLKLQYDVGYEAKQIYLGLSDQEIAIATKLRSIYGDDIPSALRSSLAAQMRFVDAIRTTRDQVASFGTSFYSGFVGNLRQGERASQAFRNAAVTAMQQVVDQLAQLAIKMAVTKTIGALFSGATGAGGGAALVTSATSASTELTAAGTSVSGAMIAGSAEASVTLEAAGASISGALIAGATEAGAILEASATTAAATLAGGGAVGGGASAAGGLVGVAEGLGTMLALQSGGIVTGTHDAVPIIAHRGEEVIRRDDPRHAANQPQGSSHTTFAPVINFTANGRMTSTEIREHSMTIAKTIADVFAANPALRRKTRL